MAPGIQTAVGDVLGTGSFTFVGLGPNSVQKTAKVRIILLATSQVYVLIKDCARKKF